MLRSELSELAQKDLNEYRGRISLYLDGDINEPITYISSGLGYTEIKELPLHVAIKSKNVDLVKELCQRGVKIDSKLHGRNAMEVALDLCKWRTPSNDVIRIIKILLSSGAEMTNSVENAFKRNKESKEIGIVLTQASINTLTTYEDTFSEHEDFNQVGKCNYAPLHYAARIGDVELINELCQKGADIHQKDKNKGYTPLEYAAENGLVLAVQALLKYQFNHGSITRASKLSHHYQKSCLWSSCLWKSYKKISGEGVVDYKKTTRLLDVAISKNQGRDKSAPLVYSKGV